MQTVGPYALHRKLSSCELGEVWAARDAAERPFTVAVLAPAAAEGGWREAFAAAANTLARSDGLPITGANHTGPVPWVACAAEQGAGAAHVFLALGQRLVPAGEPPADGPRVGPSGASAPAHRPAAATPSGTPVAGTPAGTPVAGAPTTVAAGTPAPDGQRTAGPAGPARPGNTTPEVPAPSTGSAASIGPAPSTGSGASAGPVASTRPVASAGPLAPATGGTVPPGAAPRPATPAHPAAPHQAAPHQAALPQAGPYQAAPHQAGPHQAGPHQAAPPPVGPQRAGPQQAPLPQAGPQQAARQQVGPQQAVPAPVVPQRTGPPYPPTALAPFPPAPFPPVAGPARGRGRAVLWSVLVALLTAALGAAGGYLVADRSADGPATVTASASATPSADLGLPSTPPRRPGVEPPVGGGWPAGAPTFAGTEPTREITGLAGVDFSFRVPTGWSCTEAGRTSGSAHYRCGVPAADGSIIGGDLVVRQCPRLCTDERRTALRRQEEAWGLQWIRSGEFTTWAETARVDGAPRYGLVYLSYWRSVPEDAIDRQLVLRMTAPLDRADEVRKVAASVREATFTI
ncbi:hypothetical protein [Micromonospora wenchangensis]|uniref:hypothetical protein n=1 Tax=Micromonospora wenchangensis TaxID=1185415 RepID=UPI003D71E404